MAPHVPNGSKPAAVAGQVRQQGIHIYSILKSSFKPDVPPGPKKESPPPSESKPQQPLPAALNTPAENAAPSGTSAVAVVSSKSAAAGCKPAPLPNQTLVKAINQITLQKCVVKLESTPELVKKNPGSGVKSPPKIFFVKATAVPGKYAISVSKSPTSSGTAATAAGAIAKSVPVFVPRLGLTTSRKSSDAVEKKSDGDGLITIKRPTFNEFVGLFEKWDDCKMCGFQVKRLAVITEKTKISSMLHHLYIIHFM